MCYSLLQAKNAALQKETSELQNLREDLSRQQKELCKQEAEAAAASADAKVHLESAAYKLIKARCFLAACFAEGSTCIGATRYQEMTAEMPSASVQEHVV